MILIVGVIWLHINALTVLIIIVMIIGNASLLILN